MCGAELAVRVGEPRKGQCAGRRLALSVGACISEETSADVQSKTVNQKPGVVERQDNRCEKPEPKRPAFWGPGAVCGVERGPGA